jgi:hypothetical protein
VTQRGGIEALELPEDWLTARCATAISSGPDRPEPLEQFLPGLDRIGLVTGHRLPNTPDLNGTPLNQAVLARLAAGETPQDAVDAVLSQSPEVDAGLIALDASGRLGFGNSARVERRSDCGFGERQSANSRVALLHNSIFSQGGFTQKLTDLAWSNLTGELADIRLLFLREAISVELSDKDRVHVRADGTITSIESANLRLQSTNPRTTAVYLGSEVWQEGRLVGRTTTELIMGVAQGRLCKQIGSPPIPIVMETVRGEPRVPREYAAQRSKGATR